MTRYTVHSPRFEEPRTFTRSRDADKAFRAEVKILKASGRAGWGKEIKYVGPEGRVYDCYFMPRGAGR